MGKAVIVNPKDYPYKNLLAAAIAAKTNIKTRKTTNAYDFYFTVGYKSKAYNKTAVTNTVKDTLYEHTKKLCEGDALYPMIGQLGVKSVAILYEDTYYVTITVYGMYNLTKDQQKVYEKWVNDNASKIKKSAKTEYDKALKAYQLVISTVRYGYNKIDGKNTYQTGFGAINKSAICYGISQLVYDLFNAIGVETRVARSTSHAWNVVKIGSKWYIADATRGASIVNAGIDKDKPAVKNFFLKGSSSYKDHAKRLTNTCGGAIEVQVNDYI